MRFDEAELAEIRARVPIDALIGRCVKLKKRGRELVGLCPFHNEKTPSFTVVPAKRFYHCFGCGAHGDVIGFVSRFDRVEFVEAVERLRSWAGTDRPRDPEQIRRERERLERERVAAERRDAEERVRRMRTASGVWQLAGPMAGSLAERYAATRAIDPAVFGGWPASLRAIACLAHPETGELCPVMVGGVQGPDNRLTAVHRTFLTPDGLGKIVGATAKMMLGPAWRGAMRLGRAGERLGGGEGIETSLSVLQGLRLAGDDLPIWALLSLGNFAGTGLPERRPVKHPDRVDRLGRPLLLPSPIPDLGRPGFMPPPGVREFTWFADGDGDPYVSERLLARGKARYDHAGCRLRVARPPAGQDFNDVLQADLRRGAAA